MFLCYKKGMKRIREIISENLIYLRKKHNYTQQELSALINYSDKAISRWENGESLPDYDTLEALCKIYEVDFNYMFEEHDNEASKFKLWLRKKRINAAFILAIASIWTVAAVAFVLLLLRGTNWWQSFIVAIPLTATILIYMNFRVYHSRLFFSISHSLFVWSFLLAIYCIFISKNPWIIFLIGIPVEAAIITISYILYEGKK